MSKESNSSSGGVGFAGLLTIVFITLKLCSVIDWSWWWVLSPSLIGIGIVILAVSVYGLYALYEIRQNKKRYKKWIDEINNDPPKTKSKFMSKLEEAMSKRENQN